MSISDHFRTYIHEIKQYELLTREEEIELAHRAMANDEEAIDRLITSNLRLVVKIAMKFHRQGRNNLLDLIQEGNMGLLRAARKYRPDKGTKFSYYASFWIKAYILKYVMDNWKLVKIGTTQKQRKLFFKLSKMKQKLEAEGFAPEPELLAERLEVGTEDVVEMSQRLEARDFSLDSPAGEDSRETFGSFVADESDPVDEQLSANQLRINFGESVQKFRKRLSKREADIFDQRIMADDPLVLRELGEKYNVSRERVRQIQQKIIRDIKTWTETEIPNFEEEYALLALAS